VSPRLQDQTRGFNAALKRLAPEPMTTEEALGMRGFGWEGDLDSLRAGYGIDNA